MSSNGIPEISIGSGRGQVKLKGKEAIEASGWALRVLFIAKAIALVTTPGAVIYLLLKYFLS
jgi:hypothetical protein